jgi:cellulose synthase/poly-beta-1,6-N-acetylglucosamine synthase-like glycosyltransferase
MPIRNEAGTIEQSLGAVLAQTYPPEQLEIIVSDGLSTDGTREIVQSFSCPNLRLIDNPGQIVPTGLNAAIQQATGDIIVRIDGHAFVEPDYVEQCVSWLLKQDVVCAGGAIESLGRGIVGEAIALAMSSPFGVGSFGFRTLGKDAAPQLTDTVPFGAYRRQVFAQVGLFNEKMVRHQDYEFCYRLRQAGGQILLLPQVRVKYYVRSSLSDLWRQYWQYGLWKGQFLRHYPASWQFRHLVPPGFVGTVAVTILSGLFFPWNSLFLAALLLMYSLFLLTAVVYLSLKKSTLRYIFILPLCLSCLHISWGLGIWLGFFMRTTFGISSSRGIVTSPPGTG